MIWKWYDIGALLLGIFEATSLNLSEAFCPIEMHDRSNRPLGITSSPSHLDPTETAQGTLGGTAASEADTE